MEILKIKILNPKAKSLLKDLEDLKLIKISIARSDSDSESQFRDILKRLRSKSDSTPSMDEITREVEAVRKSRYEK